MFGCDLSPQMQKVELLMEKQGRSAHIVPRKALGKVLPRNGNCDEQQPRSNLYLCSPPTHQRFYGFSGWRQLTRVACLQSEQSFAAIRAGMQRPLLNSSYFCPPVSAQH